MARRCETPDRVPTSVLTAEFSALHTQLRGCTQKILD